MVLTGAERAKRYRDKRKSDPEKYEEFRKKENARNKTFREKESNKKTSVKDIRRRRRTWRERKKRQNDRRKRQVAMEPVQVYENISEDPNPVTDPDHATYCDEEENYDTFKSSGITIKNVSEDPIPAKNPDNATFCDEEENYETSRTKGITMEVQFLPDYGIATRRALTGAERAKRYREKKKSDPKKYEEFRKKENVRHKTFREKVANEKTSDKDIQCRRRAWRERKKRQNDRRKRQEQVAVEPVQVCKVEAGLTDDMYQDDESKEDTKEFLAGCSRLKEETNLDFTDREEHLDSMIDFDNTTYIKQEDDSYLNSPHTGVKIKMVGCSAFGCTNSTAKGYIMKRFPRDPERRKIWAAKVKRENWTPTETSRLCEAHFSPEMFEQNRADGKRMVRWNAVPTIFPQIPQREMTKRSLKNKKCGSKVKQPVRAVDNVSEGLNQMKDPSNATYCDEEENYKISKSTGITIKVEPGLTDDVSSFSWHFMDFLAGCNRLKEEANPDSTNQEEHLDSMIDVDNTTYIKQEDESYLNSQHADVKIKIEPGLSEDDVSIT